MFNPSIKILIVDDMMTMRKLVRKSLTTMGYSVFEEADDGQKAWAKLIEHSDVALIVSDWNMPNCSGLDLLKRVRSDSRFRNIPFILLTAEGDVSQVTEAVTAGVDNYVLKPFTPESLREKLEQTYKKRSAV
jgi:two-component system chemotaxis response regulator CheY